MPETTMFTQAFYLNRKGEVMKVVVFCSVCGAAFDWTDWPKLFSLSECCPSCARWITKRIQVNLQSGETKVASTRGNAGG